MRFTLLAIGLLLTASTQQTASAQIDFNEVFRYFGNEAGDNQLQSQQPEYQLAQLPAVRPISTSNPAIANPAYRSPAVTESNPAESTPQAINLAAAFRMQGDCVASAAPICGPKCNQGGGCLRNLCKEDDCLTPLIPKTDPIFPMRIEDTYRSPDCCRGFWASYPEQKQKHCHHMQKMLLPPVENSNCRRECPDGPAIVCSPDHCSECEPNNCMCN